MVLDRGLQFAILEELRRHYPERVDLHLLPGCDQEKFRANLCYLEEHQLLDGPYVWQPESIRTGVQINSAVITARGMDRLEADGGIDAERRTVIVQFDRDDLRSLIAALAEKSSQPDGQRKTFSDAVRNLPVDALRHLILKLMEQGIAGAPDLLKLLPS